MAQGFVQERRMLLLQGVGGMNLFLLVFVVLAIITVFAGVKSVPQGREWTVERPAK